jgi:hypothetical protein
MTEAVSPLRHTPSRNPQAQIIIIIIVVIIIVIIIWGSLRLSTYGGKVRCIQDFGRET